MKYFIFILSFSFLLTNCSAERKKSINDKKETCTNQAATAYVASSNAAITGSYSFQYSCSATSGYSPSCYEYFSSTKKDDLCPIGYSKAKVKCSVQNLIGVCRYKPADTTNQVVTVVFTKPGDSSEQATSFCASGDINGIFTQNYSDPTASSVDFGQTILSYLLCIEKAEKN
ncbi:hypothetical protein [Leptospira idonii]|uniref:Uncharacterized protein n=1 Tax=Leptospira idonii TaxID=1193500 RepID=A0A4R9M383_9LEPT|nr:hypothetical protein [Leptospira idonii]TGN20441.1 hypothetical protein EHS15_04330 [Leptospira idonii]